MESKITDRIAEMVYQYRRLNYGDNPKGVVLSHKNYVDLEETLLKDNSPNAGYLLNNGTYLGLRVSVILRDWITDTLIITN